MDAIFFPLLVSIYQYWFAFQRQKTTKLAVRYGKLPPAKRAPKQD